MEKGEEEGRERPENDASEERAMRLAADASNDGDDVEVASSKLVDEEEKEPSRSRLERSAWPVAEARRRSIRRWSGRRGTKARERENVKVS